MAAGMDYDEVLSKSAVWQGSVSSADAATGPTVKQDGAAAVKAGEHMQKGTGQQLSSFNKPDNYAHAPVRCLNGVVLCRRYTRTSARRVV